MAEAARDEPSMEEILASIRKIISEQDDDDAPQDAAANTPVADQATPPEPVEEELPDLSPPLDDEQPVAEAEPEPEVAAPADDPLELTQVVEEDGTITDLNEPEEAVQPEPQAEPVAEDIEPEPIIEEPVVEEAPIEDVVEEPVEDLADDPIAPEPEPATPEPTLEDEPAAAMDEAPDLLVSATTATAANGAMDSLQSLIDRTTKLYEKENTIEGLVRELLKPMLKEWLDANLPRVVEEMVQSEIRRIVGKK